jgi:predicted Zn-dependent protease
MKPREADKLLEQVLDTVARVPGAAASVALSVERAANTRYARSEITSTGESDDVILSVEVSLGKRHAEATSNQLDRGSVERLVARAARLARLAPEDEEHVAPLGPQKYLKVPPLVDPEAGKLDPGPRADAVARSVEAAAADVALAGYISEKSWTRYLASSAGLTAATSATEVSHTVTARTPDGSGSGWAGAWSHRAADVRAEALAQIAADKARRSQKPRKLEPGRYTVVLEPAAVAALMDFFVDSLDARAADEGRSFFAKAGGGSKIGEKLFHESVSWSSDPLDPAAPGHAMDRGGLPRAPIRWVEAGTLKNLKVSRHWAQKTGKAPTAAPEYFHLHGGAAASVDELIKGVKKGVLVTRVWYARWIDRQSLLVTGLTRDGTFAIEDGEIAYPVNNFRWNESAAAVLRNVEAMTRESLSTPTARGIRAPAMRVADFNMASVSEAV